MNELKTREAGRINESALPELPGGWVWTRLGSLTDLSSGIAFKKSEYAEHGVRLFQIANVSFGNILWDNIVYMPTNYLEKYSKLVLKSGDILMALNRPILGGKLKIGIIREQDTPAILYQRVGRFDFYDELIKPYFFYYSQSPYFIGILKNSLQGVDQPFVNKPKLLDFPIPLPPLLEQHRIVTKLEELFTRLDAGVSALKKTQVQLKRYRQSVLKAAFGGKLVLTEAELAKAEGHAYEPADVLLARIMKERREKWNGKGKYKEPETPDTSGLMELPGGWVWANVGMISEKIQYGTSEKAGEDDSGIPVIRMGNIQDGKLTLEKLKYFPKEWSDIGDYLLQDGDVLFNRTNSAELVGKTCVYKIHHLPAVFASYLIRVIVIKNAYNPDLLSFFVNSFYGRKYIGSVVTQQVGQANVNGTKLSQMPIPLPPFAEQLRIVDEVERLLSIADVVGITVGQSLTQSERLCQSILKMAFEGRLVGQDASDESAGVLLERIKLEKMRTGNGTKKSKQIKLSIKDGT